MAGTGHDAAAYAATLVQVVSHASEPELLRAAAASSIGMSGSFAGHVQRQPEKENLP